MNIRPLREWTMLAKTAVAVATGGAAIITFVQVAEPYTPATRAWVRDFAAVRSALRDQQLAGMQNENAAKLDDLAGRTFDLQLAVTRSTLQSMKGEEVTLKKRLQVAPDDELLSGRLIEVQANIRDAQNEADTLRCEIAKRRGWPCGVSR